MASPSELTDSARRSALLRTGPRELERLIELVFSRYPRREWATFARFGWRDTPGGLVVTLAALEVPDEGDLDETVGHVALQEQYSLRVALAAEGHRLGVGVVHSHPRGCAPVPSSIDDDMDGYYAGYLSGFTGGRPYVSLVLSETDGQLALSGRVSWRGEWLSIDRATAHRRPLRLWVRGRPPQSTEAPARVARLTSAFGDVAAQRLRSSTVAVIGAGGTGSAAIEVLARAGVGTLILIDPDHVEESNLERLHGGTPRDAARKRAKVEVARDHVQEIDPSTNVVAVVGALPQESVVDAVLAADVLIGCSDQQHSRLAISDLAARYLVASIDCGVAMEGRDGQVTGQIVQLLRLVPGDPCVLCRGMVSPERLAQELMSPEERQRRREAAAAAAAQGGRPDAYWREVPQLHTVGYLTTTAGALAAGYAIGWITGRFEPPFARLQFNLQAKYFDVTDTDDAADADCPCQTAQGTADQGSADALVTTPPHWPPATLCVTDPP